MIDNAPNQPFVLYNFKQLNNIISTMTVTKCLKVKWIGKMVQYILNFLLKLVGHEF